MPESRQRSWLQIAKAYVQEIAPKNVSDTMVWLEANGWQAQEARGGPNNAFIVIYERAGSTVTLGQDRGPWTLDVRLPGWKYPSDLGIILDAAEGRLDRSITTPGPASQQAPEGVDWRAALPVAFDWLGSTVDAERIVHSMKLKRSRTLFPSTRQRRRAERDRPG